MRVPVFVAFLALAVPVLAHAASYARTSTVEIDGSPVTVDVYEPGVRTPVGVAIVAHGWTRSRARHRDAGRALAEAGVVAIVPDLPNYLDLWGNGTAIVGLVGKLEAGALGLPPVDRSSIVLIGTSAGGLATVWAASKLPGLAGWVGLDPVDRTGTGMYAASKLDAPAIVLLGDASACNLFSSGRSLASSVPRLVRAVKIDGASHCDFEAPTNSFCSVMCGFGSPEKQREAQHETVLAALELLALAHAATAAAAPAPPAPPMPAPSADELPPRASLPPDAD